MNSWIWAARAAEEQGDKDAAQALYKAALPGDNYYSAMAAARLGERVVPRLEPIPLDAAQVDNIAAADAFRRVRELTLTGLRDLATIEWQYGYRLLPEGQRLQAIHLAARWEIYDVAVALATSHSRFNDYTLLYPRPHVAEVAAAAKLTDVDAGLLYGVLRQESLFRTDAASAAGPGTPPATPAAIARQVDELARISEQANDALMRGDVRRYAELVQFAPDFTLMSPFGGKPSHGVSPEAIRFPVAAVSTGIVAGEPMLDLAYNEDSAADTDFNFVITGSGHFVEIQGAAEGAPFSDDEYQRLVALARKGAQELFAAQQAALGRARA
jgi:hypothetical protein